jgi:hypothetical protein
VLRILRSSSRAVVVLTIFCALFAGLVAIIAASSDAANGHPAKPSATATRTPDRARTQTSTRTLLRQLAVTSEHSAGYDRDLFKLWDSQGGGCDTRDRVLITEAITRPHVSSSCALTDGKWRSPYDRVTTTDPSTFDIDHLVPLAEAWQSGAWRWSGNTREAYANDLGYGPDLVAVTAHSNRSKGDSEPSAWLPTTRSFDCTYEAWWVAVKWRWHLSVDSAEKRWLSTHLATCGWPSVTTPSRPTTTTTVSAGLGTSDGAPGDPG